MHVSQNTWPILAGGALLMLVGGCFERAQELAPGPFTADVTARVLVRSTGDPFHGLSGQAVTITFRKLDNWGRVVENSESGPTVVVTDQSGWAEWTTRYTLTSAEKAWVHISVDSGTQVYDYEDSKPPNIYADESEIQTVGWVVTMDIN